jgi:hypothetical protein
MEKLFLLFNLMVMLSFTMNAQTGHEQIQKLKASDGTAGDNFGESLDVSGNYAIIGAPYDNENGNLSGSAYIFHKNEGGTGHWGQTKKLTPDDGAFGDRFGYSVSISGNYALVGAHGDDDNGDMSGSAYIFHKDQGGSNNWGQVAKLTSSDGAQDDWFGYSVSISGQYALVGALYDDDLGNKSGSAYIFYKDEGGTDSWGEKVKIKSSGGTADDWFGHSVFISSDTAIVGAPGQEVGGIQASGAAYIFYKDEGGADIWGQKAKLTASDAAFGDYFGFSVSISGENALVSSVYDDHAAADAGSAYIFNKDEGGTENWGEVIKLTTPLSATADEFFGHNVYLSGTHAVIGAIGNDMDATDAGILYWYSKSNGQWTYRAVFRAKDAGKDYFMGNSVVYSDGFFFAGASGGHNEAGYVTGSAYIFGYKMPDVWKQPNSRYNVCGGDTVHFFLRGFIGSEFYQWQVSTDGGNSFSDISNGILYSGVQNDTLVVQVSGNLNNNKYRCKVTNTYYPAPIVDYPDRFYTDTVDLTLETQAPTLTPQNDTVYLDAAGQWKLQPSAVVAGASDNCALADTTLSQSIFTGSDIGVVTIDITLSDFSGNSVTRQADVFVEDTTLPALTTRDTTVYLDASGNIGIRQSDVISAASDNCEILDTLLSQSSFACSDTGLTTIKVTVNDVNGNSNTQTADVTVRDTLKPNVTCPSDQTVDADDSGAYTVQENEFDLQSYGDNCSVTTITNDFNDIETLAGENIPAGTHNMNWEVIDASGNSQSCSFEVEVSEYTSIKSLNNKDLKVYPNPTDGKLHIHSGVILIEQLTLTTLSGRKVIDKTKVNKVRSKLDMSGLAPGVYILRIQSDEGLFTTKIIHQP